MSSSVFFKFKSQKEPTRVPFDGTGISVFELKRAIIEISQLGDGTDFDLAIYNEDTNEEYEDDTTIIPRSTSIVARRLPPAKSGRGGAARYVSGKMPVHALNNSRAEKPVSKPAVQGKAVETTNAVSDMDKAQTEEEKIAAMFKAGAEQWDKQQQEMANATPVYRNAGSKAKPNTGVVPSHPPPPGYVCYRCGEKGHWIQECPTNNDPNFDGRPRVKRTTGIPKSFLRTIEKPPIMSNDGLSDGTQQPSGVMVNADGDFVIAVPDQASWEQYEAKAKQSAIANEVAESGTKELQERGLECPIDKKLFIEPTKTPCCKRVYCSDCITNALIESDLRCPGCQSEPILIDHLKLHEEVAAKVAAYLEEKDKQKDSQKREKEKEKTPPSNTENGDSTVQSTKQARTPSPKGKSPKSPQMSKVTRNGSDQSRKRSAEDQAEDQRLSLGSSQMKKSKSQQSNPASDKSNSSSDKSNSSSDKRDPSSDKATSQTSVQVNGTLKPKPLTGHPSANANSFNHKLSQPGLPMANQFMGMPISMGPVMGMNPTMMVPPNMNGYPGNMTNFPGMGGPGFIPPQQGVYGGGYNPPNFMVNGGFGNYGQNMPMPMSMPNGGMSMGMGMGTGMNMAMGMGMNPSIRGNINGRIQPLPTTGGFPNQQRTVFSEPPLDAEDNAYFRRPVNPHRHQTRQRRARPSDYREL